MHYFMTVHAPTDNWIRVQWRYLKKNLKPGSYKILAVVPGGERGRFDYEYPNQSNARDAGVQHRTNLNFLTEEVLRRSQNDEDVLIALDGDAFPVVPLTALLDSYLTGYDIFSIQKVGALPPIPRNVNRPWGPFLAMKIRTWKKLGAQWGPYRGRQRVENVHDSDGDIVARVLTRGVSYYAMPRSNRFELLPGIPAYFALFGGVIYHHGMGFREPTHNRNERLIVSVLWPEELEKTGLREIVSRKRTLRDQMFAAILRDDGFWRRL